MKKIEAIIREERFEAVRQALEEKSYFGITVSEVSGRGHQKGIRLQQRVGEYCVSLLPKIKIEVVVLDNDAYTLASIIRNVAKTGEAGDGKIFILPVEDAIRIRTGETGINAV